MQSQVFHKSTNIVPKKPWLSISFWHDCSNLNNACCVLCAFRKPQIIEFSIYFWQIHIVDYKVVFRKP